jgi:hypothetical protein
MTDLRRYGVIEVYRRGAGIYDLTINGQLWSEVEWSPCRGRLGASRTQSTQLKSLSCSSNKREKPLTLNSRSINLSLNFVKRGLHGRSGFWWT